MKLFEKIKKVNKDNRGITFVELICAIGILSLVGTAVVGLVLVASRSYQRSVMEIEVQQEAQFAANLIGDLLKDATDVPSTNPIVIQKGSETYTITYSPANKCLYLNDGSGAQLLAEYVDGIPSVAPSPSNASTYTVNMGVSRVETAKSITVNNSNNARNQAPEGTPSAGELNATILAPSELVMEPNFSAEVTYAVMGISNTAVTWSLAGNTDANTKIVGNTIQVGPNETADYFMVNINTVARKSDGVTPAGSTSIMVYVRRVTAISLSAQLLNGADATAGALYRIYANVSGFNLDRKPTVETDYISPYAIDWSYDYRVNGNPVYNPNDYYTVTNNHSGDGWNQNYIEVRLNRNLDTGARFTIQANAAHPRGRRAGSGAKANKSGILYSTSIFANYIIEGHIYTLYPGNFYRGSDQAQGSLEEWTVKQLVGNQHGIDPNQLQVFKEVRYRVTGTNNWTPWIQLNEGGNAIRIHEDSWMFACDKDYDIEIRFGARTWSGQKLYPTNLGESAYTIRTGLQHVRIRFDVSCPGFNQTGIYGVGPVTAPIRIGTNTNLYFNVNQQEANRQAETGIRWERFNKSLVIKVQKYQGNRWVDADFKFRNEGGGNPDVRSSADSGRNLAEMTRTGNYLTFYKKGTYRILIGIGNAMGGDSVRLLTYNGSGFNTTYENYNLWNEATGEGIFYIKVE